MNAHFTYNVYLLNIKHGKFLGLCTAGDYILWGKMHIREIGVKPSHAQLTLYEFRAQYMLLLFSVSFSCGAG